MYLENGDFGGSAQVCFVVYATAVSALAAHSIFGNHDIYGEFTQMEPYFIPLARYTQLISETELTMFSFHQAVR